MTVDELQNFLDSIDNYNHKLMFDLIYELAASDRAKAVRASKSEDYIGLFITFD